MFIFRPIEEYILVEYTPHEVKQTSGGIYIPREDALDFLELKVLRAGKGCKKVKDGDTIYIRKESLFQTEYQEGLVFMTKENLLLKMNGKAINKNVLVKPIKEEISKGGIVTNQSTDNPQKGVVLDVGDDVKYVSVGDVVIMAKYATLKDGENCFISEAEILGVLED